MDNVDKRGVPSFKEKNDIGPVTVGSAKKAEVDMGMFSADALGSEMCTNGKYASKGGAQVNKNVVKVKPNKMMPD